ncbi:MAG TPA: hypothetical protein VHK47_20130 [Polyangia bacterium]|jgi:hypothetical protein|nr:hypothetical protein [Polyangia bacterium]
MARSFVLSLGCSILIAATFDLVAGDALAQSAPPPPGYYAPPPAYYAPPAGAYAPPPGSYAAPPAVVTAPARENSINGSPLGVIFGAYSLNYEHLSGGTHGFVVEGSFAHTSGSSTEGSSAVSSTSKSYDAAIGYRWHWSGRQDSGFLGLMAGYGVGSGSAVVSSNGTSQSFDLTLKAPRVVANIGKRWQWDGGFNITFRIGAGWAKYTVSTSSTDPDAQEAVNGLQHVLTLIPIALDGELSIGYSF